MDPVIAKLIPIFILALIGFISGKTRILPKDTSNVLCSFLFYFCGPAVSFSNIISSDFQTIFNLRFALAMIVYELSIFALLALFFRSLLKEHGTNMIIHAVCSFYGNISYVGIPVFLTLFNNAIPNVITLLIHGILTFPLVVFLLDWFSGAEDHSGTAHAVINSFKNPNIFVPVIAAVLLFFNIRLPQVITDTAELLGKPTTTVGMFALGLTCSQSSKIFTSGKIFVSAVISTFIKLIINPIIVFLIGKFIFRLDEWWLNSMIILAMLPAALNDFILSQRYHSDEEYAGVTVLMSTILFAITLSVYLLFIRL